MKLSEFASGLVPSTSGEEAAPTGQQQTCILALYVHGRMHSYFVAPFTEQEGAATQVLQAAKRALDALNWHGPATVWGRVTADESVALARIEPYFANALDAALEAGIHFPLSMWRAITGYSTSP
jgi:hypothetical protein